MIDQDQSKYEVVGWRRPNKGELYFFGEGVQQAGSPSTAYPTRVYIVKLRKVAPAPVVNYAALLKPAPLLPLKVEYTTPQPVLVAEFFDADGNTSTNTFYDADLARDFYDRA